MDTPWRIELLVGAAEAMGQAIGLRRDLPEHGDYDRYVAAARQTDREGIRGRVGGRGAG